MEVRNVIHKVEINLMSAVYINQTWQSKSGFKEPLTKTVMGNTLCYMSAYIRTGRNVPFYSSNWHLKLLSLGNCLAMFSSLSHTL